MTAQTASAERLTLVGLSLGYFMVLMDTTVATIALPAIGRSLGASAGALEWVNDGYTVAFAALLLGAGVLADRLGGRRVFLAGSLMFVAVSALTAVVGSMGELIACRIALGVAGATLVPTSLALIAQTFPDPVARARAVGAWAAISGAALAAGPVIGGILTQTAGWRAIFLVNIPVGLVSVAIVRVRITRSVPSGTTHWDLSGQLTAALTLGALTYALVQGPSHGWASGGVLAALAVGVLAAAGFVAIEARAAHAGQPTMVPVELFAIRRFNAGLAGGLLVNVGLSGLLFVLSLAFQEAAHNTAIVAGLRFLPMTIPTAFNPLLTSRIVARIGPRLPVTIGFTCMAAGSAVVAVAGTADHPGTLAASSVGLLLIGTGVSFAIPSLVVTVVGAVPAASAGAGSGLLNAIRQVGATIGVAVLGGILATGHTIANGAHTALLTAAALLAASALLMLLALAPSRRPAPIPSDTTVPASPDP